MTDILIRGLDDDALRNIDAQAKQRGLSRNEYLKRLVTQPGPPRARGTVDDLRRFAEMARDLKDDDVMRQAWS
ncbi:hypothetical protein [Tsukamurella sp. NPDC003166]|uniref:type II toxin-antitoxin system VapB family antitoxin n=1 Tax=Tsukamurella sp. NPDC003166 TaxID=3154444 RepID=UPI0033A8D26D